MFENRPLSNHEKNKMHPHYQEVINHYEKVTKRPFTKDEVVILKLLVKIATPAVINQMITRFYKQYPENFKDLNYIYQPVKNMFGNKKRGVNKDGRQ